MQIVMGLCADQLTCYHLDGISSKDDKPFSIQETWEQIVRATQKAWCERFHVRLNVAPLIICIPYIFADAILDSSAVLLKSKRLRFSLCLCCTSRAGL